MEQKSKILLEANSLGLNLEESDILSPYDLEYQKGRVEVLRGHKRAPSGKVSSLYEASQNQGTGDLRTRQWQNHEEMIDFLVSRAEIGEYEAEHSSKPNPEIIALGKQCRSMLDELWNSAIQGRRRSTSERRLEFEEDPSKNPNFRKSDNLKLMR